MIGLLCANASLGVGFELARPDVAIVSGRGAAICAELRAQGRSAICVEEAPRRDDERVTLSGAAILDHAHIADGLRGIGATGLLPFKPSRKLEARAGHLGLTLYAADAQLVRQLENKLQLPGIAAEAEVRAPESVTVVLDDALLGHAPRLPRVFQPAVGFAGAGTRVIADVEQLSALAARHPGDAGKLTRLIDGAPVTVAGCVVGPDLVLAGQPVRQLTGVPICSSQPFGSCGNDWSIDQASTEALAVRDVASRVGAVLAARGFRGLFGIDTVVDAAGDVWLIEVNPRITASLSLALQLQAHALQPTLLDAHLLAFAPDRTTAVAADLRDVFPDGAPLAQLGPAASLILYNRGPARLTPPTFSPGRYRVTEAGGLQQLDRALHVAELGGPGECIVLPASSGFSVSAGAELCRVVLAQPAAADPGARTLTPVAQSIAEAVRAELEPALTGAAS